MLGRRPRARVGLLGGSFNPAHDGHRFVAQTALKRLGLDEVWLMVSPQNPLKPESGMAPFTARLAAARRIASGPHLRASAIETALGTRFTADTLAALARRFPRTRFVWLMGADNLRQVADWDRWTRIFHTLPVAVFARPGYHKSVVGVASRRFASARLKMTRAKALVRSRLPVWVFFHTQLNPQSGTAIRSRLGNAEHGDVHLPPLSRATEGASRATC